MSLTLEEKAGQTVKVLGSEVPKWQDCNRCGAKLACMFYENVGYYQPCEECRKDPEYRKSLDTTIKEREKSKKISESLEARKPAAYHATPWGTYLITNKRGDVIDEKKIGEVESKGRNQKAKVRPY